MEGNLLAMSVSLIYSIPQLIIVGVCVVFIIKKSNLESVLLLVSTSCNLLLSILYTFLPTLRSRDGRSVTESMVVYQFLGIISMFFQLMFAVGLILLIVKYLNHFKNQSGKDFGAY